MNPRKKELKIVCAWCPDAKKKTKELEAQGYDVSHGICPKCLDKLKKKYKDGVKQ